MALDLNGLAVLARGGATAAGRANIFSVYTYATADAPAAVETAAYFDGAASFLTKGDVIICSMTRGGTPVAKTYIVTANTGTAVTIVLQTVT